MKVQGLNRTLADKIFAICDYYMQNRVKKHSRHIYGIYKLLQIVPQTGESKALVKEVRSVRAMTNICPSAQPKVNVSEMLDSLYNLIAVKADYDQMVNETVRLSLYGDFLYPLAEDSTLEQFYREKPEGDFCEELTAARTRVWEALRPCRLKLLRPAPAKFIHFGTTREILELMGGGVEEYRNLGWSSQISGSIAEGACAGYSSVLSSHAAIGENCYLEVSNVHSQARIGSNVVLSYIDIHDGAIPDNVVFHGLKQRIGKTQIYAIVLQLSQRTRHLMWRFYKDMAPYAIFFMTIFLERIKAMSEKICSVFIDESVSNNPYLDKIKYPQHFTGGETQLLLFDPVAAVIWQSG